MVSIVAFQAVDPGSIPGPRTFCNNPAIKMSHGILMFHFNCKVHGLHQMVKQIVCMSVCVFCFMIQARCIENIPPAGLEPATPRLEVWCSIH